MYYNDVDDPLSAHLFSLHGEKWKHLRAAFTPTFTPNKLRLMFPTIVNIGHNLIECLLEARLRCSEIEIKDFCARFSTDVIGTCAFGIDCNSLNDPTHEFRHFGRKLFEKPRHSVLWRRVLDQFSSLGRFLHIKKVPDDIAEYFINTIRQTIALREERNEVNQYNDFIDLMISLINQNKITFNQLAAQAFVFFQAGFESSATTLAFCLYELALNPKIQTKARRIIREAYQKFDGNFNYEMLMDLPFIGQIIEGD